MVINSKYISYLLRHDVRIGNLVDDHGFLSLEDLNQILWQDRREKTTEQQLIEIAEDPTTKKRFEYEYRNYGDDVNSKIKNKFYIRALNGHSFPLRANIFEPWSPSNDNTGPKYIYHVTNHNLVKSIMNEGLKPMARQFIHLYEHKHSVKFDRKRNTLLEIGPIVNNQEELKLFHSKNGYLMCPHVISTKFIKPVK